MWLQSRVITKDRNKDPNHFDNIRSILTDHRLLGLVERAFRFGSFHDSFPNIRIGMLQNVRKIVQVVEINTLFYLIPSLPRRTNAGRTFQPRAKMATRTGNFRERLPLPFRIIRLVKLIQRVHHFHLRLDPFARFVNLNA